MISFQTIPFKSHELNTSLKNESNLAPRPQLRTVAGITGQLRYRVILLLPLNIYIYIILKTSMAGGPLGPPSPNVALPLLLGSVGQEIVFKKTGHLGYMSSAK